MIEFHGFRVGDQITHTDASMSNFYGVGEIVRFDPEHKTVYVTCPKRLEINFNPCYTIDRVTLIKRAIIEDPFDKDGIE
jgi:hypothetical protein